MREWGAGAINGDTVLKGLYTTSRALVEAIQVCIANGITRSPQREQTVRWYEKEMKGGSDHNEEREERGWKD